MVSAAIVDVDMAASAAPQNNLDRRTPAPYSSRDLYPVILYLGQSTVFCGESQEKNSDIYKTVRRLFDNSHKTRSILGFLLEFTLDETGALITADRSKPWQSRSLSPGRACVRRSHACPNCRDARTVCLNLPARRWNSHDTQPRWCSRT